MKANESSVTKTIKSIAPLFKCMLFRNNVGLFHVLERGRKRVIKTGLCKGSSDLIGYTERIITPDMVGQKIAVFTAIEVKKEDWKVTKKLNEHENNQKIFLDKIKEGGGLAGFVNSIDSFKELVD